MQLEFLDMEDNEPMFVCLECLGDPMLRMSKVALMSERICAACGQPTRKALTPKRIAHFIGKYLPTHFMVDYGLHPGYEMTLADVVNIAIRCDNALIGEAIAQHLIEADADEEGFYWPGQEYCWAPSPFESEEHERWWVVGEWNSIAEELSHGRRFFNDKARKFFDSLIFEALNAESAECPGTLAVIKTLPSGTNFYRARTAKNQIEVQVFKDNPAKELGAPPKEHAGNNRMSAAGVSLLYVSQDTATCIAEVQPSAGATVVVGEFSSTSPLTIFDFTALSNQLKLTPLSLFSPGYQRRGDHQRLLHYLHDEIAQPVRVRDTHYVMTQALAEFIRYHEQQPFDGISFRSVQHDGGVNFVLFDKSNSETMYSHGGRSRFDLEISNTAVTTHHFTE